MEVYVGIGGSEFYIESQRDFDDFERWDDRTYIIGDKPKILPKNSEYIGGGNWNHYPIKTENLHFYPAYVRAESDIRFGGQTKPESCNTLYLDYVEIKVNPEKENITYCALMQRAQGAILKWVCVMVVYCILCKHQKRRGMLEKK